MKMKIELIRGSGQANVRMTLPGVPRMGDLVWLPEADVLDDGIEIVVVEAVYWGDNFREDTVFLAVKDADKPE